MTGAWVPPAVWGNAGGPQRQKYAPRQRQFGISFRTRKSFLHQLTRGNFVPSKMECNMAWPDLELAVIQG